jgi:hypothetical protein
VVEQWHAEAEEMLPEGTEVNYLVGPETGHRRAVMLMQTATAASLAMRMVARSAHVEELSAEHIEWWEDCLRREVTEFTADELRAGARFRKVALRLCKRMEESFRQLGQSLWEEGQVRAPARARAVKLRTKRWPAC